MIKNIILSNVEVFKLGTSTPREWRIHAGTYLSNVCTSVCILYCAFSRL